MPSEMIACLLGRLQKSASWCLQWKMLSLLYKIHGDRTVHWRGEWYFNRFAKIITQTRSVCKINKGYANMYKRRVFFFDVLFCFVFVSELCNYVVTGVQDAFAHANMTFTETLFYNDDTVVTDALIDKMLSVLKLSSRSKPSPKPFRHHDNDGQDPVSVFDDVKWNIYRVITCWQNRSSVYFVFGDLSTDIYTCKTF